MGKVINHTLKAMSRLHKARPVLIFTLLFSLFMIEVFFAPRHAEAVAVGASSPVLNRITGGTTATSYTVTNAQFACGAGSNRLMVLAVTAEYAASGTAFPVTANKTAAGTNFTEINRTAARVNTWVGYLNESQIQAAGANSIVVNLNTIAPASGTVMLACYSNVDQLNPIVDSKVVNNDTAIATTIFSGLVAKNGGMVVYAAANATATGNTVSPTAGYTERVDYLEGASLTDVTAGDKAITVDSTEACTLTWTIATVARNSGVIVSLRPYPDFIVGNGTDPSGGGAPQGSTGKALDAFTLAMSSGTGTVSTLTLTGSAQSTSANVAAVKIYRDNGTLGTFDGADVLVATTTAWAANVATITFTTPESVSTTTGNYLVVIDVAAAATVGNALSGTITAATGTGLGTTLAFRDTASGGLTISTSGLTVGNGFNPANASAPQGSLKNATDAFSLYMGVGTGTVSTLTLTGSAQFTSANVATIRIYRDKGTIGTLDNSDILVPINAPSWASNVATLTFTSAEAVTTTPVSYLVVIDAAAAATVGNTLSGTITAATGTGLGTPIYSDSSSGTLTIAAGSGLTIGNGTNPANANAPITSNDNALDAFTTVVAAGKGQINTLTLTGSANFTTANIANIKVFVDKGTVGTLDGADMLVPTTYTHAGTVATITFTNPEPLTTTTRNYLVVVDIQPGATVGQTFTGTITAVTGSGYTGAPTYSDAGSATLTIAKALFANSSCASCHGYSSLYYDGSARNSPTGAFVGSHATHAGEYAQACSVCHVTPATTTSADYNHQNGTITMATPINGDASAAYGKGASWPSTNSPTAMQACSNTYCHSQGVSKTAQAGDTTRAISTPLATLNWGDNASCDSCHGNPPNYPNGAATWGGTPKANSHGVHTTHCETCHNGTTSTGDVITNPALHTNKAYNIAAGNGETIGSYTYSDAGGTCADISCHGGVGINNAQWGTSLDCTTCHNKVVNSPRAAALNAAVTTRRNVAGEFANTWSHKRSAGGAVTKFDCCVCHMEGDTSTGQADLAYHGNGYIELRDPDLGATIKQVTHSGTATTAGSYASTAVDAKFVRFSRNLSVTLEADPDFLTILGPIMTNLCLKCHDTNGATNSLAQVPGGSPLKPFATTITGHVAPYDSNGVGNVVDVNKSFATTNASYHPVRGKGNNSYVQGTTQMQTPYTATKTNGNNTQYGYLISCWDCHAPSAATGAQTSTVTAHGAIATLRGTIRVSGTTAATNLCLNCHALKYSATTHVSAGSALVSGPDTGAMSNTYFSQCAYCHAYGPAAGANGYNSSARPLRGEDAHGFNDRTAGTPGSVWGTTNSLPYAFIRNTLTAWRPLSGGALPAGSGTCTGTASPCDNNMTSTTTYTPGGAY